jgi:hypothetical protein
MGGFKAMEEDDRRVRGNTAVRVLRTGETDVGEF